MVTILNPASVNNAGDSASSLKHGFGNQPAIMSGKGRRAPDKRRVSLRWMSGSILTGVTSVLLMGGALYATLEGRQQLAQPANKLGKLIDQGDGRQAVIGDRPNTIVIVQPVNEKIINVPTVTKVGNSNVIRKRPFAYASAPLAIAPSKTTNYPKFNPLTVFRASGADKLVASSDVIYGADVEGEVRTEFVPFSLDTAQYDASTSISAFEAERIVHKLRVSLNDGRVQTGALPYLDTSRFVLNTEEVIPASSLDIRIVPQNVSTALQQGTNLPDERDFMEEVISVPSSQSLSAALENFGFQPIPLGEMVTAMSGELGTGPMDKGTKLRIFWEQLPDTSTKSGLRKTCRRISVYRGGNHIKSIALNDIGTVVWAVAPAPIPAIAATDTDNEQPVIATVSRKKLPNIYDGLYRAALSQGLSNDHAGGLLERWLLMWTFGQKSKPPMVWKFSIPSKKAWKRPQKNQRYSTLVLP